MTTDWYTKAREEFLQDLASFNSVDRKDSDRIYAYLNEVGLIDYDVEKDFLYDEYADD